MARKSREGSFFRLWRCRAFPLSYGDWDRFPKVPNFKNEYWDGKAHLSPRPRTYRLVLDLGKAEPRPEDGFAIRQVDENDWPELARLFHAVWRDEPPLMQWGNAAARRGAQAIMLSLRRGDEGPLIPEASLVALSGDKGSHIVGAAFVTRCKGISVGGNSNPPETVPHLTWIFVSRWHQRSGVASTLLGRAVRELRILGHDTLFSTVLDGRSPAMLWHWRNGFMPVSESK